MTVCIGKHDRRSFLWHSGGGLGGIAPAWMLGQEKSCSRRKSASRLVLTADCIIRPRRSGWCSSTCPARPASATCSTTSRSCRDDHGEKWDPGEKVELFQIVAGKVHAVARGTGSNTASAASGSATCVPHLGDCVDDIAFIHNMVWQVGRARPGHVHAGDRFRPARLSQHGRVESATAWAA